jgi:hypothetical protein
MVVANRAVHRRRCAYGVFGQHVHQPENADAICRNRWVASRASLRIGIFLKYTKFLILRRNAGTHVF